METISITIPKEKETLLKTADYLRDLACVEVAEVAPVITGAEVAELLSPQEEADAMGDRIDDTVATARAGATTLAPGLDKSGCPWDARIHASSKAFIADGTWRLKRGVDPALVESVKAELSQGEEPVVETVQPIAAPVAVAPAAPPIETPAVAALAAAAPAAPAPPALAAPVAITTYAELIPRITAQANAKLLQPSDVLDALTVTGASAAGAINLTELAKPEHAVYIPLVAAELERIWATRV